MAEVSTTLETLEHMGAGINIIRGNLRFDVRRTVAGVEGFDVIVHGAFKGQSADDAARQIDELAELGRQLAQTD